MKAIQYTTLGGPEVLRFVDVPDPTPGPGEIVMRIQAAAMNHLDIHFRCGLPGMKTPLPHIPGSDGAGIVEAIGDGVTGIRIGDRIALNQGVACGACPVCKRGLKSLCHKYYMVGRETDGTYAELVRFPAANAIPIPSNVSFETAAAAPLVYLTAWSMIVSKANVKKGDTVLVMGAGSGVGMAAIQIAKMLGATVIATASTDEKTEKAKTVLGADHSFNYTKVPIDKEVRQLTGKQGVDVAIDHIGGDQWVPILRATRNGGTVVTCGATAGFEPKEDLRQIFFRQIRVLGSTMGTDEEMNAVMKFVFNGKLKPLIDHTYPLKDAAEANRRMESRESFGKIVLIP
ncbi:MAG: zinc-binding dehydrogenase [Pseudomonadota bacterium]